MAMNPEIKARWIAALRSDEYTQGFSQLTTVTDKGDRRHCCLGVLSDLAVKDATTDVHEGAVDCDHAVPYLPVTDDEPSYGEKYYLPKAVAAWAGIELKVGVIEDGRVPFTRADGTRTSLAGENDGGASFADIADIIEQHF